MKKTIKFVSVILSGVLALSLAGCSSGSNNKKVVKEAEAVLEELTSLDYKGMKERDAYSKQYIFLLLFIHLLSISFLTEAPFKIIN